MNGGFLIREMRQRAAITQEELARRLGMSQSAIARWESGSVSPRLDTLERIAEACDLDLQILLTPPGDRDRGQIVERLRWSPGDRLDYLLDMLAFEEQAHRARSVTAGD